MFWAFEGLVLKIKTLMDIDKIDDIPEIVVSAFVLHNICIAEDEIEGFF